MSDRITTTCQHSHTVTLRLDEGEWFDADSVTLNDSGIAVIVEGTTGTAVNVQGIRADIRAELEAALGAAEASCGGCGCAERLRAEAERLAPEPPVTVLRMPTIDEVRAFWMHRAADFLDAAPDARGSDVSAEQPTPVSEQGHAKKRAEWNDPNGGRVIPDGFVEAFQKVSDDLSKFLDQEATDG